MSPELENTISRHAIIVAAVLFAIKKDHANLEQGGTKKKMYFKL